MHLQCVMGCCNHALPVDVSLCAWSVCSEWFPPLFTPYIIIIIADGMGDINGRTLLKSASVLSHLICMHIPPPPQCCQLMWHLTRKGPEL